MIKIYSFITLFIAFIVYSSLVYTAGTASDIVYSSPEQERIDEGKRLFQDHNCIACHQLYGLGGYLGPDLTTAWSDKDRGESRIKYFLKAGGNRMPDFHFAEYQVAAITSFLRYVDSTASTYKSP
jgi:nitric oxide reductase subunit C